MPDLNEKLNFLGWGGGRNLSRIGEDSTVFRVTMGRPENDNGKIPVGTPKRT